MGVKKKDVNRLCYQLRQVTETADKIGIQYRIHLKLDALNNEQEVAKDDIRDSIRGTREGKAGKIVVS